MPAKQLIFTLVTFFHDLFTATWIGGLIVLGLVVIPSFKHVLGPSAQTKALLADLRKRLSRLVYVSMAGLALTGMLLSRRAPEFQHLFYWGDAYGIALSLKHLLMVVMVAIALYRSLVLERSQAALSFKQQMFSFQLIFINLGVGVLILLLSAFLAVISA